MKSTNTLSFHALGPLLVRADAEIVISRPAQRRLLSTLLLDCDSDLSVDLLIDRMWDDAPPSTPKNSLQAHISALRRKLGPVIASTATGYSLHLENNYFDVAAFGALARDASSQLKNGSLRAAADHASSALDLWRGDPFPDLSEDVAARGRLQALHQIRLTTHIGRIDALLGLGSVDEVLPELETLVGIHPFEERLWERLMIARYRLGNQAGALRAYQAVRDMLGEELGIEPGSRLKQVEMQILMQDPWLGDPVRTRIPHNLPEPHTSFVGRGDDVDAIVEALERHRLVSIVGGPGMGKTRLAVEAAREVLDSLPGGVSLVRLAGASSESDVAATIAAATGMVDEVEDIEELAKRLSPRPMLIVLDNCEHVLDPVRSFVSAATTATGSLRMLATSRQRIGLEMEQIWRLRPLGLPDGDTIGTHIVERPAVQLLIDRATRIDPSFRVTEGNATQVAELCRRTAGIPLAIELAATWIPSLSITEVIEYAGSPAPGALIDLDGHHRSLDAAVEWSTRLLAESDRELLAAASIFRGSFVLQAFHDICAPAVRSADAAGAIARLVEASVITAERRPDGVRRYRILEPVRERGQRLLEVSSDGDLIHRRHAEWFQHRAKASLDAGEDGQSEPVPMAVIDDEIADHRAALRTFLDDGNHSGAATIATSLSNYWFARYLGWEAVYWLDEALDGIMDEPTRVRALRAAGWAAYTRADYVIGTDRYTECLNLARAIGDRGSEGLALYGLARIDLPRRHAVGLGRLNEALAVLSSVTGMELQAAECVLVQGIVAADRGRSSQAAPLLEEAAETMAAHGHLRYVSVCHRYLSLAAWYADDERTAMDQIDRAEHTARSIDDYPAISGALIQRALVEAKWGDMTIAAEALIEALAPVPPTNDIDHCLIFFGVFPVLIGTGRFEIAAQLFNHLDRMCDQYGWMSIDQRMPAGAQFRADLSAAWPGSTTAPSDMTSAEIADVVRKHLAEIAASPGDGSDRYTDRAPKPSATSLDG